jgi:hypothetical protein
MCKAIFKNDSKKSFYLLSDYSGKKADLVLSLDVIYHLIEDKIYEEYMQRLFSASNEYVIIYSSDMDDDNISAAHVKRRKFTKYIAENIAGWILIKHIPNKYSDSLIGAWSDFFIYQKI